MKYLVGAFIMLSLHWTSHLLYLTNGDPNSLTTSITSKIDDLFNGQVIIYPWWK